MEEPGLIVWGILGYFLDHFTRILFCGLLTIILSIVVLTKSPDGI